MVLRNGISLGTHIRIGNKFDGVSPSRIHDKTLIEMWIICLDPVSANSEKGSGSEWAVRVGQRVPSRFGQSRAAREMNLVQIVV